MAFSNRRIVSAVLFAQALLLASGMAMSDVRADVFTFTDADGVVHFTNVPPNGGARPLRQGQGPLLPELRDDIDDDNVTSLRRHYRVDEASYDALIVEAARYYTLPPALVKAVVAVESSFQHQVVSHAGAQGLMQLLPSTAAEMFVANAFDARENIYGGTRYLRVLANRFAGDLRLTLAAYNSGPDTVERNGGVPRIEETQRYVRRVLALYRHYSEIWRPDTP